MYTSIKQTIIYLQNFGTTLQVRYSYTGKTKSYCLIDKNNKKIIDLEESVYSFLEDEDLILFKSFKDYFFFSIERYTITKKGKKFLQKKYSLKQRYLERSFL